MLGQDVTLGVTQVQCDSKSNKCPTKKLPVLMLGIVRLQRFMLIE
jgi:hypothetical protein